jgi:uncharacterized protein (TIGR03437 family)
MKLARLITASFLLGTLGMSPAWCQAPSFTISTVAGTGVAGSSGDGGPAVSAELNGPRGVTVDASGNLYIAEFYGQRLRMVNTSGIITTVAGNGNPGYSGDGGQATSASLDGPYRVTIDAAGNIYIPDSGNSVVRKVATDGTITTVAGNGSSGYSGDGGLATSASLNYPEAVAFDAAGNYYIADEGANVIRKVDTAGIITTFAGTGAAAYTGDGGPAASATLDGPVGVAIDAAGDVYISDQENNVIRKVNTSGIITTVVGTGKVGFSGDGGPAIAAEMYYPASIGLDASGNLYIPDINNYRIRVLLTNGNIQTVAGDGIEGYGGDDGPALDAEINAPRSVAAAANGNVYIGDFGNNRVRLLTTSQAIQAPPSIGKGGVVSASSFGEFTAVAPGSWIEIYGTNLAASTQSWQVSDFNGVNAPTKLNGTTVTIGGQLAFINYISQGQVDAQVPSNVPAGLQQMTVTTAAGVSSSYAITVNAVEPGFDAPPSFSVNGVQYVVALFTDGAYVLPTGAIAGINSRPAQPGDTIILYGVGFGPVTPNIPAGQIVEEANSLSSKFSISFGGTPATVSYAGLAPNYIGLYQFNVVVPTIPSGNTVPVTFSLGGVSGTQTLYTAVQ